MRTRYLLLSLTFPGFVLLAGCGQDQHAEPPRPPTKVVVANVVEQAVTPYADFTGRATAIETVKVRARVWGYLKEIKFTEGAEVKKDSVLFVIDRRPYQATLDRAEAEVQQAEARAKRLQGDL